jgi:hypothetical protein
MYQIIIHEFTPSTVRYPHSPDSWSSFNKYHFCIYWIKEGYSTLFYPFLPLFPYENEFLDLFPTAFSRKFCILVATFLVFPTLPKCVCFHIFSVIWTGFREWGKVNTFLQSAFWNLHLIFLPQISPRAFLEGPSSIPFAF